MLSFSKPCRMFQFFYSLQYVQSFLKACMLFKPFKDLKVFQVFLRLARRFSLFEVSDLLKLFEQSPDFAARYQLVLAGGGRALEQVLATVRKLKDLGLAVIHFGGLSLESMPAFYSLVDVLVVPSRTAPNWKEQFGRTIIEAQACGTVVVGSDSGEIPQVVADSSRIFSEGNLVQMEACITRAMTVDTKARIVMREKNSTRFSDRALAAKFAANIERILV